MYSPAQLARMVQAGMPAHRVIDAQPLAGGLRNTLFKLRLDPETDPIVLRIYAHEPALCQKEADLHRLVHRTVPVPEILHVAPEGIDGSAPFVLMRYVEGIQLRALIESSDDDAIAQAVTSCAETLAAIGRHTFPRPGWLGPGPTVMAPLLDGADPVPRFIDRCLAAEDLQRRVDADLREQVRAVAWSWAPALASLDDQAHLVHCDFGARNLLVGQRAGRWTVTAVVDWEFAVAGAPLIDVGNFLRHERRSRPIAEPHFSRAFVAAGGTLPPDWRRLARVLDLTALCEKLARPRVSADVVAEVIGLLRATAEDRDPD